MSPVVASDGDGNRCGGCRSCARRWPRTSALLFGVVLPLFSIIGISVVFGYCLAHLEGPDEIATNNDIIRAKLANNFANGINDRIAEDLPYICACAFLREEEQKSLDDEYAACLAEEEGLVQTQTVAALELESAGTTLQGNNSSNATNSNCVEPPILEKLAIEMNIQQIFIDLFQCPAFNRSVDDSLLCNNETTFPNGKISINANNMFASLNECGEVAKGVVDAYRMEDLIDPDLDSSDLTFHWIRCSKYEIRDLVNEMFNPFVNDTRLRTSNQGKQATDTFRERLNELYCQHLEDRLGLTATNTENNITLVIEARLEAMRHAIDNADGFTQCYVNTWAGGWFWFTIMTTIGYGNTVPVTTGGRAMVFTLGFFSVLFFAAFLAKSGSIVVAIVDDWLHRIKLPWLTRPSIEASVWGVLYYLWILLIAYCYKNWNRRGVDGDDISVSDAYWFAYITTTTIGLGDYFLEHAAISSGDLLTWPLLILFGFVLLSAFANNLGELVASFYESTQSSLAEMLANDERPVFSCCSTWFRRRRNVDGREDREPDEEEHQSENMSDASRSSRNLKTASMNVEPNQDPHQPLEIDEID